MFSKYLFDVVDRQGRQIPQSNEADASELYLEQPSDKEKYNRKIQRQVEDASKRGGTFYPDPNPFKK